jgi:hypothetical protein
MKRLLMISVLALLGSVAQAQSVLVYDHNTKDQVAQTACNNLGLSCTVANSADFVSELTGGNWDVVVMDLPSNRPEGDWQGAVSDYIAGGGRAIQTGWAEGDFASLADDFEVIISGNHQPIPFYQWDGSALFTTPNAVPTTMNPVDDDWITNGFLLTLTPAGSGVAAAGFVPAPADDQGAVVIGNTGRTIFNGLLWDDYYPADDDSSGEDDIVEMVENQIMYVLEAAPDSALFHVTKTFSDGSDYEVEVMLTCNSGLPLEQTFTIAGGDPDGVTFVVTDIPESGATCEVTESGGPDGYTTVLNGGDGCTWEEVVVGRFRCDIDNVANPATYTVEKEWAVFQDGGDVVIPLADVTIECDSVILNDDAWFDDGTWYLSDHLGDGESLMAYVDVTDESATCSATEDIDQSGVESVALGCSGTTLSAGGSHTCVFRNTVFFEGIPTLSQYGLALLVLLTLGVGFVGLRRFV